MGRGELAVLITRMYSAFHGAVSNFRKQTLREHLLIFRSVIARIVPPSGCLGKKKEKPSGRAVAERHTHP